MIIKVWSKEDRTKSIGNRGHEPTYTIEMPDGEIDHFIKLFGEVISKGLVEGLERQITETILKKAGHDETDKRRQIP